MHSSRSNYVFIYDGRGVYSESGMDLKELFSTHQIFHHPVIRECDFNINFDGLNSRPTFVVPGGSAGVIGGTLIGAKPEHKAINNIKAKFGDKFNYVGICAGAFIGTDSAEVYNLGSVENSAEDAVQSPKFNNTSLLDIGMNIGVMPDYKAIGPFYPHGKRANESSTYFVPHRVKLTFQFGTTAIHPQLYVAGPGFVRTNNVTDQRTETVAIYSDQNRYVFFNGQHHKNEIENMPAIIRRIASKKEGGRFLSGTHIESCVPNSKVLSDFMIATNNNAVISEDDLLVLRQTAATTHKTVEALLKETLRPRKK